MSRRDYWRWFVFRELRKKLSLRTAALVSAITFSAHHAIIISAYVAGDWAWFMTPLLTLAVAVGGFIWALEYETEGTLLRPWVSHLFVDASLFWMGYELAFKPNQ